MFSWAQNMGLWNVQIIGFLLFTLYVTSQQVRYKMFVTFPENPILKMAKISLQPAQKPFQYKE